ncbi:MAG: 4-(cytidine 5'-diphospho)-2-C-methyl-D-erythritol kinase [Candidatus Dadabacteria bacterium]|nr:4-(cytidine 5'-diphospho)-2-C-methyl-D-erythritol kinase [Candidatus Dadabacteria bacterium]NIQ14396.1 4-(cytidine 5'-diphospho)-2-C-methyl-D-erythritol kinase [Candidatus Dadabacteria bacterium]
MEKIKLLSPSKVNLTLRVLGKRDDGYHYIQSIFQPINLFDEIEISLQDGNGINLEESGIEIPDRTENIVIKAAKLYLKNCDLEKHISINLKKRIPIGAGLGGGSANGAAILIGLNKILKKFDDNKLTELAIQLGADVPFFIRSTTALIEGVGEKITLLNSFPLFYYVLLFPGIHISTKDVYQQWDKGSNVTDTVDSRLLIEQFTQKDKLPLINDLEKPAFQLFPELNKFKDMFYSLDVKNVIMTGSGSTLIGVFTEENEAKEVYNYLNVSAEFEVYLAEGIKGWHFLVD